MSAYTVSDMLASANSSMGASGGSVSLKRRCAGGLLLDATAHERGRLDSAARVKSAALALQGLTPPQKLTWALAKKEQGNARFRAGDAAEAVELYITALAGLDFGGSVSGGSADGGDSVGGASASRMGELSACQRHSCSPARCVR